MKCECHKLRIHSIDGLCQKCVDNLYERINRQTTALNESRKKLVEYRTAIKHCRVALNHRMYSKAKDIIFKNKFDLDTFNDIKKEMRELGL